jgi:hypothetical protein
MLAGMGIFTAIHYVIGIPDPASSARTPFQGFPEEALVAADVLLAITQFPTNIIEVFSPKKKWEEYRARGSAVFSVHLCHLGALSTAVATSWNAPWWVVILPKSAPDSIVRAFDQHTPQPLVLVERFVREGTEFRLDFGHAIPQLKAWALSRLGECADRRIGPSEELRTSANRQQGSPDLLRPLDLIHRGHNVTLPSELALEAVGFQFQEHKSFPSFSKPSPVGPGAHNQAMFELADRIYQEREQVFSSSTRIIASPALDLIVSVPSMRADMHTGKRVWAQHFPDSDSDAFKQVRQVLRIIGDQEGTTHVLSRSQMEDMLSPAGQMITEIRNRELDMLTAATAVKASEQFCPAIRLPPLLNKLRPVWNGMARCARGSSPHKRFKLNSMAKRVADQFVAGVDPALRTVVSKARTHVKLVGDLPLELMRCERLGVVLSVSTPVSRIPTLPGDLAINQLGANIDLLVPASKLREVLILRSFDADDELRGLVEEELREYLGLRASGVSIVDVDSIAAAERALASFQGGVVIFDMHGGVHGDIGTLSVGNEEWDIMSSQDRIRIPPVVVFSACDTAPIDGTAASVASAALYAGAKVVVGTLLPVNGKESAMLMGRLVLRLYDYVPAAHRAFNRALRWTEIFGGMMKMSYVTDVLRRILGPRVTREEYMEDSLALNTAINGAQPTDEWWHQLVSRVAYRLSQSDSATAGMIRENFYFTETCKYAMFGAPEHLLVMPDRSA